MNEADAAQAVRRLINIRARIIEPERTVERLSNLITRLVGDTSQVNGEAVLRLLTILEAGNDVVEGALFNIELRAREAGL